MSRDVGHRKLVDSAPEVEVKPDASEATLEIAVAKDVSPGDKTFVTVRGTAKVKDKPVSVDAQITVKVAKSK